MVDEALEQLALRPQLMELLVPHLHDGGGAHLRMTGHSMGGAMAMLMALELQHVRRCRMAPATAMAAAASGATGGKRRDRDGGATGRISTYTFAAPRVGDATFARLFDRCVQHTTPTNDPSSYAWPSR